MAKANTTDELAIFVEQCMATSGAGREQVLAALADMADVVGGLIRNRLDSMPPAAMSREPAGVKQLSKPAQRMYGSLKLSHTPERAFELTRASFGLAKLRAGDPMTAIVDRNRARLSRASS